MNSRFFKNQFSHFLFLWDRLIILGFLWAKACMASIIIFLYLLPVEIDWLFFSQLFFFSFFSCLYHLKICFPLVGQLFLRTINFPCKNIFFPIQKMNRKLITLTIFWIIWRQHKLFDIVISNFLGSEVWWFQTTFILFRSLPFHFGEDLEELLNILADPSM